MPIAVAVDTPQRFELKTLPANPELEGPAGEAGFVLLKRLSHGDKMTRRSYTSKMTVKSQRGRKDVETELEAFNERVELFDFANCVVDHNLTDEKGNKLDFRREGDVRRLDGRVAEEIQSLLDKLNNFEEDEAAGK